MDSSSCCFCMGHYKIACSGSWICTPSDALHEDVPQQRGSVAKYHSPSASYCPWRAWSEEFWCWCDLGGRAKWKQVRFSMKFSSKMFRFLSENFTVFFTPPPLTNRCKAKEHLNICSQDTSTCFMIAQRQSLKWLLRSVALKKKTIIVLCIRAGED